MKAKDLKILRKKLTKANRIDNDPLSCFSKDTLSFSVLQKTNTEPEAGLETDDAERNLSVKFVPSSGLSDPQLQSCFSLFERNMGDFYRNSSWGLNLDEKLAELKHDKARFLLLTTEEDDLAGFVHFRFEYDDEESPNHPVLYVYEIQIDETFRRQGLGQKLMDIAEKIAGKAGMAKVMLTVFKANTSAMDFYQKLDYSIDESSPSKFNEPADYEILSSLVDSISA